MNWPRRPRCEDGFDFVIPPCERERPRSLGVIVWLLVMLLAYILGFAAMVVGRLVS